MGASGSGAAAATCLEQQPSLANLRGVRSRSALMFDTRPTGNLPMPLSFQIARATAPGRMDDEYVDDDELFCWHVPDATILAQVGSPGPSAATTAMMLSAMYRSASPTGPPARMRSPPGRRTAATASVVGVIRPSTTAVASFPQGTPSKASAPPAVRLKPPTPLSRPLPGPVAFSQWEDQQQQQQRVPGPSSEAYNAQRFQQLKQHWQQAQKQPVGANSSRATLAARNGQRSEAKLGSAAASRPAGGGAAAWAVSGSSTLAMRQQQALRQHCLRAGGVTPGSPGPTNRRLGGMASAARPPGPPKGPPAAALAASEFSRATSSIASSCSELQCTSVLMDPRAAQLLLQQQEGQCPASAGGGGGFLAALPSDARMLPLPVQLRRYTAPPAVEAAPGMPAPTSQHRRDIITPSAPKQAEETVAAATTQPKPAAARSASEAQPVERERGTCTNTAAAEADISCPQDGSKVTATVATAAVRGPQTVILRPPPAAPHPAPPLSSPPVPPPAAPGAAHRPGSVLRAAAVFEALSGRSGTGCTVDGGTCSTVGRGNITRTSPGNTEVAGCTASALMQHPATRVHPAVAAEVAGAVQSPHLATAVHPPADVGLGSTCGATPLGQPAVHLGGTCNSTASEQLVGRESGTCDGMAVIPSIPAYSFFDLDDDADVEMCSQAGDMSAGGAAPQTLLPQDSRGFSPQAIRPQDLGFSPREGVQSSQQIAASIVGVPPLMPRREAEGVFATQAQNSMQGGKSAEHPDSDESSLGSEETAGAGFAGWTSQTRVRSIHEVASLAALAGGGTTGGTMGSSGPSSVSYQAGGSGTGQPDSSSGRVGRFAWLGKVVRRVKAKFEERGHEERRH